MVVIKIYFSPKIKVATNESTLTKFCNCQKMRRSGGTSALLQKVNAQLRGERVPISKPRGEEDDGVGVRNHFIPMQSLV